MLAGELTATDPGVQVTVAADITDADAPARIAAHVESEHGRLDLLVNNAGAAWRASFADGGWENVRRHMALNFDAQVRVTEALLPLLRASAPSAIVNVASTAGRVGRDGTGAYSAGSSRSRAGRTRCTSRRRATASTSASSCRASSRRRASRSSSSSTTGGRAGSSRRRRRSPTAILDAGPAVGPSATCRACTGWGPWRGSSCPR